MLAAHIDNLRAIADGRPLWLPAFNYDYLTSGLFDVANDPSQVGPVTEHFRTGVAAWRTATPVFTVSGLGDAPFTAASGTIDPFGEASIFAELVRQRGSIIWYGAKLPSSTIIHYAERRAGGPPYRYDKRFRGTVIHGARSTEAELVYHVRPLGRILEYDWDRIARSTIEVRRPLDANRIVWWAPAAELADLWIAEQGADSLSLLNAETRAWVEPSLERLGRRFILADFEDSGAT